MTVEDIKARLSGGICDFKYTKRDGSERTAKGTLNVDIIAEHNATPKGPSTNERADYVRYFDINSDGWRSFCVDNFVEFIEAA